MLNTKQKILDLLKDNIMVMLISKSDHIEMYHHSNKTLLFNVHVTDFEEGLLTILSKALDEVERETRKELLEEIIRDIPVCEDKFSKCSCVDHDMQDGIMDYLNGLQ